MTGIDEASVSGIGFIDCRCSSTSAYVVSVPLDAQVSDMSHLRKKLVSEVDACIAVKCWQKINPDYPLNIELDLDFKSPIASKLKLEIIGKDRSGKLCISREGVVDELFDIKNGKIYCEKWFQLLNGYRTAYDGMMFSGAADPVRPYNGLSSQTIFGLILEK